MLNLFLFLCITVQKEVATSILQKHSESLSLLTLPTKIVHILYTEGVISKETYNELEQSGLLSDGPLRALSSAVSEDPNKLRVFSTVLLKSKKTINVGQDILKEYSKLFIFYRFIVLKFCIDENFPQVQVWPSQSGL